MEITLDAAATNGLYTIDFDAEALTLVDAVSDLDFYAINDSEPGTVVFGFAAEYEIAADATVLTLNFEIAEKLCENVVNITANEFGAEKPNTLETVDLGEGHVYLEPEWTWTETEDGFTASAIFTCAVCDEEQEIEATVTSEEVDGKIIYTATIELDGETYTDTKEVDATILGDANGDGSFNARDIALMQRYVAGWEVEIDLKAADINGDGKVNARDIALAQRLLAGWDPSELGI